MREDQQLHHGADDIDPQRGPQHLGDEEEPRPGAVRGDAETVVEVLVERNHPQPVEGGYQHESHDELPHREAPDHLHVGERIDGHGARNRDERHARHGGSDHGEGRHVPRRAAVSGEKPGIVGTAARNPRHDEQDGYVAQNGGNDSSRSHNCGKKVSLRPQRYKK